MAKRKNDTKYHEVLKQAAGYSYKNGSPSPDGYKVVKSVDNKDTGSCVGSYSVSGYTRSDGTKVGDYTRSCGAKH